MKSLQELNYYWQVVYLAYPPASKYGIIPYRRLRKAVLTGRLTSPASLQLCCNYGWCNVWMPNGVLFVGEPNSALFASFLTIIIDQHLLCRCFLAVNSVFSSALAEWTHPRLPTSYLKNNQHWSLIKICNFFLLLPDFNTVNWSDNTLISIYASVHDSSLGMSSKVHGYVQGTAYHILKMNMAISHHCMCLHLHHWDQTTQHWILSIKARTQASDNLWNCLLLLCHCAHPSSPSR